MSETKFTPGPWVARQEGRGPREHWHVGINGYLSTICKVNCVRVNRVEMSHTHENSPTALSLLMDAEEKANAHLIAAAPELYKAGDEALAALYGAREVLGDVANISHAINMLESAARKARGYTDEL